MTLSEISFNKEDFESSDINKIIEEIENKDCLSYAMAFRENEKKAEKIGNQKLQKIYNVMYSITSLTLNSEDTTNPYSPMIILEGSRSPILNDVPNEQLLVLNDVWHTIIDDELKARVADILWISNRNYKAAQGAIKSYIKAAIVLEDNENWSDTFNRIKRAVCIAKLLGKNGDSYSTVQTHIKSVIEKYKDSDPSFLLYKMMNLLYEMRSHNNSKDYSKIAEILGNKSQLNKKWHIARAYWEIKEKWDKLENKNNGAVKLYAETYVSEAEESIVSDNPNYALISHNLQQAIEAFRKIPGTEDRRKELHSKLLICQKESIKMLKKISHNIDISEEVEKVRAGVKGKHLYDALLFMAFSFSSPSVDNLRAQVLEDANKYIFQNLFGEIAINEIGNTIGRMPSMDTTDPEEKEAAIRARMLKNAEMHRSLCLSMYIEPIRRIINQEHSVTIDDLLSVVTNNPYVPQGREYLFASGLHAGLKGDFLISTHLLIPQLENTIRYVLQQYGLVTSGLSSTGIQDERPLTTTIFLPELEIILGKDIVFDLQGLLVERFGQNLRNRMAHGLMGTDMFYTVGAVYLWWLTLRICLTPIRIDPPQKQSSGG